MKRITVFGLLVLGLFFQVNAQEHENEIINSIFDEALTDYTTFENLEVLCKTYPGRITGSNEVVGAVK